MARLLSPRIPTLLLLWGPALATTPLVPPRSVTYALLNNSFVDTITSPPQGAVETRIAHLTVRDVALHSATFKVVIGMNSAIGLNPPSKSAAPASADHAALPLLAFALVATILFF